MSRLHLLPLIFGFLILISCSKGELTKPNIITDITIDWLANRRDKSKPFFLMHHYKAPHDMFEFAHLAYQEYLKRYLRCVKGVDDNVGRLFAYLEENDLMDNTIIIYTGDQGFMLGEHDYIDKRWMYEESQRMPFLVRYPGKIKVGTRTNAIVNNVDYAPTMIEVAGGSVPDYMQGESFKSILYSGEEPEGWKQDTYYRYWMHMAHRHANLAYTRTIAQLKNRLSELREEIGEIDEQFPQIQEVIKAHWND